MKNLRKILKGNMECKIIPLQLLSSFSNRKTIEFLTIASYSFYLMFQAFVVPFLFIWCLFGPQNLLIRTLAVLYLVRIIAGRKIGSQGGSKGLGCKWFREKVRLDAAKEYFPIDLIKTVDLPPDRNYLFAVFPHGVFCYGVVFNFVSSSSKFWTFYPKIRAKVLTMHLLFHMPLLRELLLLYGAGAASAKCLKVILSASNDPNHPDNSDGFTSNAAVIVPGGVREIVYSRPGEYRLVGKSRKGYVKQAIINGSALVPVFSFGEIDLYDSPPNPHGSKWRKWQEFSKRWFQIPLMRLSGAWGFIPKRKPINTVVGSPIDVVKNENPSAEYIDEIQEKFLKALEDIFETYKSKYVPDYENVKLIFE